MVKENFGKINVKGDGRKKITIKKNFLSINYIDITDTNLLSTDCNNHLLEVKKYR